MPFNGSGVFQRVRNWVADATAGIKVRADYHDAEDDGFALGLTNCITKDGQTIVTQNIPFNNKRVTGLADPVNPQDAVTKTYADTKLSASGGNTMTGDLTVSKGTPSLVLDSTDAGASQVSGTKNGKQRWLMRLGNGEAESGANAGSNFDLNRYDDSGTWLGAPITINRANGMTTIGNGMTINGAALTVNATAHITGQTNVSELRVDGGIIRFAGDPTGKYIYHDGNQFNISGGRWNMGGNPLTCGAITSGALTAAGTIQTNTGLVISRAAGGAAQYVFQDSGGTQRGNFYWDGNDKVVVQTQSGAAIAIQNSNGWVQLGSGMMCRQGLSGGYGTNVFNIYWNGSSAQIYIDNTPVGGPLSPSLREGPEPDLMALIEALTARVAALEAKGA